MHENLKVCDGSDDIFSILASLMVNNIETDISFDEILQNVQENGIINEIPDENIVLGFENSIENISDNYIYEQDLLQDVIDIKEDFIKEVFPSDKDELKNDLKLDVVSLKNEHPDLISNFNKNKFVDTGPKEIIKLPEEPVKRTFGNVLKDVLSENKKSNFSNEKIPLKEIQLNIEKPQDVFVMPETKINNVEVFESSKEIPVYKSDIVYQLVDKIEFKSDLFVKEIKIELNPENLGEVKINLTQDDDGVINAKFIVQNEIVKADLAKNLEILTQKFSEQNIKVNSIEISIEPAQIDNNYNKKDNDKDNKNKRREYHKKQKGKPKVNFIDLSV